MNIFINLDGMTSDIIRGNQRTEIIINDKFPIAFRFRPIEKLINELGFVCIKEEEDEAIR